MQEQDRFAVVRQEGHNVLFVFTKILLILSAPAISLMNIPFDPVKNRINLDKHGVSLALSSNFEWDEAIVWMDERKDYGEPRFCGIGYIGARLYYIVYVDRGETRRIISLRKANIREVRRYAEA